MSVKEYLLDRGINNFDVVIDGIKFSGEVKESNYWEIKGRLSNGVEVIFKSPSGWGYSRVMQFLGNLIEARIV